MHSLPPWKQPVEIPCGVQPKTKNRETTGQGDGSVDKRTYCESLSPLEGERREPTLQSCPLVTMHVPWYMHMSPTHIHHTPTHTPFSNSICSNFRLALFV